MSRRSLYTQCVLPRKESKNTKRKDHEQQIHCDLHAGANQWEHLLVSAAGLLVSGASASVCTRKVRARSQELRLLTRDEFLDEEVGDSVSKLIRDLVLPQHAMHLQQQQVLRCFP